MSRRAMPRYLTRTVAAGVRASTRHCSRTRARAGPILVAVMDSILYDTQAAFRRFPNTLGFTLAAMAMLPIAIGASSPTFRAVDGVLQKPLPNGNTPRLGRVASVMPHAAVVGGKRFSLLGVAPGSGPVFNRSEDRREAGLGIRMSVVSRRMPLARWLPRVTSDSIVFAGAEPSLAECAADTAVIAVCRVKRPWSAEALRSHLGRGEVVWREGDELTIAHSTQAEDVRVCCTIQASMSHIVGTDLWFLTVRAPFLDTAMVEIGRYHVRRDGAWVWDTTALSTWRGSSAPVASPRSSVLRGRIASDTLFSRALGERRAVTVYVPPSAPAAPVAGVVYAADGDMVPVYAPTIDTLITTGALPPILIVGIHAAMTPAAEAKDPAKYRRALEYMPEWGPDLVKAMAENKPLVGFSGFTNPRFVRFERFVLNEVLPWAEHRFGVPSSRQRRTVFGSSNGGRWAVAMGMRHPGDFGNIVGFSVAGAGPMRRAPSNRVGARYYMVAGAFEPGVLRDTRAWADSLRAGGADVLFHSSYGGHDTVAWSQWFPDAIKWAFRSSVGS